MYNFDCTILNAYVLNRNGCTQQQKQKGFRFIANFHCNIVFIFSLNLIKLKLKKGNVTKTSTFYFYWTVQRVFGMPTGRSSSVSLKTCVIASPSTPHVSLSYDSHQNLRSLSPWRNSIRQRTETRLSIIFSIKLGVHGLILHSRKPWRFSRRESLGIRLSCCWQMDRLIGWR